MCVHEEKILPEKTLESITTSISSILPGFFGIEIPNEPVGPFVPEPFTTPALDVNKNQSTVDRIEEKPEVEVLPGDVFSCLVTAINLFGQAVYISLYDELDQYPGCVDGSLTVNDMTVTA
ncbi:hypothetical protein CSA56_11725 [candidate division KSB3 bacterium]|uniref:Uncharacterized protein n=1 Tax=candidate division KSB3 bacterium TaxID=2044937 RepID=A0A2G6KCS9_9BACT|nr:MAG: hypothetical protein CSA56_11725 [candidate division KSB3 bacterium]